MGRYGLDIALSNDETVEVLAVDFTCQRVDWRRKTGYTGACATSFSFTSINNPEADLKAAIEIDVAG